MIALAGVAIHAQEKTSQDGLNDQSPESRYTLHKEEYNFFAGQFLRLINLMPPLTAIICMSM